MQLHRLRFAVPVALALLGIVCPSTVNAQSDTLVVPWSDSLGHPVPDALYNAVQGDTLPDGSRTSVNRVYKLLQGGHYLLAHRLENKDFPLRLVGEPGDPADSAKHPPMLQMQRDTSMGADHANGMLLVLQSVLLKNLYLTGRDDLGKQDFYQPIHVDASGALVEVDHCILEHTNFALIGVVGQNNVVRLRNNLFRNLVGVPSTTRWEGRGISIWADQDSVLVENNTFFNCGMTALLIEGGSARVVLFNHNTLVNVGRAMHQGTWWKEAYVANNLLINVWWHGEGAAELTAPDRDMRADQSGVFSIGALPGVYGPEGSRRILFSHAAAFLDPAFLLLYGDTVHRQWFVNRVTIGDHLASYPETEKAADTVWLASPPAGFAGYPAELIDSMKQNITDLRRGAERAAGYLFRDSPDPVKPSWPIPENFTYTDSTLLTRGTDGLPLGDLNWFPALLPTYWQGREAYFHQLTDMVLFQAPWVVSPDTLEAENGIADGTARTVTWDNDTAYYRMNNGGYVEWSFPIVTSGAYDLRILQHMRGGSQHGQHLTVNGRELHDVAHGWGEFVFDVASGPAAGIDPDAWAWVKVTQADIAESGALTLPAGNVSIRIAASWGMQDFSGIELLPAGAAAPVVRLTVAEVTDHRGVEGYVGALRAPSGFRVVSMGENGGVTFSFTAGVDCRCAVVLDYQTYQSGATASLQIDGEPVPSGHFPLMGPVSLPWTADTLIHQKSTLVYSPPPLMPYPVSGYGRFLPGAHTLRIAGTGFSLDRVILVVIQGGTGIGSQERAPRGFSLEQNFPNPFNPSTTISFTVPERTHAVLEIFSLLGQRVATVLDGLVESGVHEIHYHARGLASGVYLYRLRTAAGCLSRRMMVLR